MASLPTMATAWRLADPLTSGKFQLFFDHRIAWELAIPVAPQGAPACSQALGAMRLSTGSVNGG
jgi:hypothetical protein